MVRRDRSVVGARAGVIDLDSGRRRTCARVDGGTGSPKGVDDGSGMVERHGIAETAKPRSLKHQRECLVRCRFDQDGQAVR